MKWLFKIDIGQHYDFQLSEELRQSKWLTLESIHKSSDIFQQKGKIKVLQGKQTMVFVFDRNPLDKTFWLVLLWQEGEIKSWHESQEEEHL